MSHHLGVPGVRIARSNVRCSLLQLALCLAPGVAGAATDEAPNVVDRLLRHGSVVCEPAWPVFCANIHVACAGQTTVRTFAFTLRADGSTATLTTGDDGAGIAEAYARLRVMHDAQNQAMLLLPDSAGGYLKLRSDGHYSFRHYVAHRGIMSAGRCG